MGKNFEQGNSAVRMPFRDLEHIDNLISSVHNICRAVINLRGDLTIY